MHTRSFACPPTANDFDFKAADGEFGEAATEDDARLMKELLAFDNIAEAVVLPNAVSSAFQSPSLTAVKATGSKIEGAAVTAGDVVEGKAWSDIVSFKPCSLRLTTLPQSISLLSNLKLLWANDNTLTTLPSLPPLLTEVYLHRNKLTELSADVMGACTTALTVGAKTSSSSCPILSGAARPP